MLRDLDSSAIMSIDKVRYMLSAKGDGFATSPRTGNHRNSERYFVARECADDSLLQLMVAYGRRIVQTEAQLDHVISTQPMRLAYASSSFLIGSCVNRCSTISRPRRPICSR